MCLLQKFSLGLSLSSNPLDIVFHRANVFILIKPSSSIIYFTDHAFGAVAKKSLPSLSSSRFSLICSFRSFIALCFTFRPMIHFELTVGEAVSPVARVSFLVYGHPVVLAPFVKETVFAPLAMLLLPFVKSQLTIFMGVHFCTLYSVLLIYYFINTTLS